MTVFKLLTFPNVCRACLQPLQPDQMVSLDAHRPLLDGSIGAFLEEITFQIPEPVQPYLPPTICFACIEVVEFFYKYRQKMMNLHQFLVALVRVKLGDESPLKELFHTKPAQLEMLFCDLDLCDKADPRAEDLLEEYDQYVIASMPHEMDDDGVGTFVGEDEVDGTWTAEDVSHEALHSEDSSDSIERLSEDIPAEPCHETGSPSTIETQARKRRNVSHDGERNAEELNDDDNRDTDNEQEPALGGRKSPKTKYYRPNADVQQRSCKLCSYKTYYTVVFELHLKKHEAIEGKSGFGCAHPYCLKLFDTKRQLEEHQRENNPHKYVCEICGAFLKHRSSFDVHMERHVGITHFQCSYCTATFFTHSETSAHVAAMHLSEDREECTLCGSLFTSRKLLNQHLKSHATVRNFHCTQCARSFKSQHHLNRHIKTVHEVVRFHCDHCAVSYGRRDKLRLHLQRVHMIQTYFVCQICVRLFDTQEALQEHLYRHENPKELECGICLIVCRSPKSFQSHTCITYRDDYICCGRDFKNHQLYNRHMATHGVKVNARVRPGKNETPIGHTAKSRRSVCGSEPAQSTATVQIAVEHNTHTEYSFSRCEELLPTETSAQQYECEQILEESDAEESESLREISLPEMDIFPYSDYE